MYKSFCWSWEQVSFDLIWILLIAKRAEGNCVLSLTYKPNGILFFIHELLESAELHCWGCIIPTVRGAGIAWNNVIPHNLKPTFLGLVSKYNNCKVRYVSNKWHNQLSPNGRFYFSSPSFAPSAVWIVTCSCWSAPSHFCILQ